MKYLYYPFDDRTGLDTLDKLAPAVGTVPSVPASPRIGELYRSDGTCPAGLWNVGVNDEVFVIGHAAEGMKVLADAQRVQIDQTEIVARLARCGLRANENCKIVLYACESGKGGPDSLGAKVASALKNNNFACCNNVWGFNFKVSMRAHKGALCIQTGGSWLPYEEQEYVLMHCPPNH